MRKIHVPLLLALCVAIIALPAMAMANAGVHGNYSLTTDACAGCHRAHTAPSELQWHRSDGSVGGSALLLTTATEIQQFCMVCHDTAGQGAETNVEGGQYNAEVGLANGAYGTPDAPLLGGAFGRRTWDPILGSWTSGSDAFGRAITSQHNAGPWQIYGGGAYASTSAADVTSGIVVGPWLQTFNCTTCHDVHGSSNYRILKDYVWGVKVGGYATNSVDPVDPDPTPFVWSCETGYPVGGFRLHTDYIALGYVPNYTRAQYAQPANDNPYMGMTGWCAGCHTVYNTRESTYDVGNWDLYGFVSRHRHPMNVPLTNYAGPRALVATTGVLPLANDFPAEIGVAATSVADWIECLTCHNAHGSTAVMTGFANVGSVGPATTSPVANSGAGGVPPVDPQDSALLKLDNRGVCEACHNK